MSIPFLVGNTYSRKDVYNVINVPEEKQKGNWNTGYTTFDGDVYVFANINSPGRTGHDYDNKFIGDNFQWFSKNTHKVTSPTIKTMLNPEGSIYIFTREESQNVNFTDQGVGNVKEYYDTQPVKIIWEFTDEKEIHPEKLPEEVTKPENYFEGSTKTITVNIYERNRVARNKCIEFYGCSCSICDFNFQETYGDIGKDFIHVHHLKELNLVGEEYEVDPVADLRPVCPNCHAILHKRKPAFSISEVKTFINKNK